MTNMSNNKSAKKSYARSIRASPSNAKFVKPHRRSFLSAITKTAERFCEETTFHGLKNLSQSAQGLSDSNLSKRKRATKLVSTILCMTACALGVSFAVVLIHLVWTRFQSTPTITTIETNNYPIWNVPFPAVTLCNVNKVYRPATINITEKLVSRGLTEERVEQFYSNLSKLVQPEYVDDQYTQTLAILAELNYTTERLMFELMQPCSVMLENCTWLGKFVPCESIFRVSKSSEGFCCSFNYNALRDNLEVNSETNSVFEQLDDPVRRVSGAGQFVSLEVLLRVSMSQYVAYTRSYYGISVMIHSPEDYPQASSTTTVAQPGCDVILAIIPSVVVSEPAVRTLAVKQRNCYFEDEKKLRTTEKYSFQSCITECAVDTIVKQCGCLPFYYSEILCASVASYAKLKFLDEAWMDLQKYLKEIGGKTRQCNLQDVGCMRDNRHIISSLQPLSVTNETLGMNCPDCLPSCSDERYGVQSIIAKRFEADNLTSLHYSQKNLSNYVTLKVHFKDISCLKYRRDIFMTWDGFLASFGGIFGLCLGGSLISFIEIFYFLSFKLFASYHESADKSDPKDDNRKPNEINIFKISSLPIADDTLTMRLKFRNQSKMDTFAANSIHESVSHDRYLD